MSIPWDAKAVVMMSATSFSSMSSNRSYTPLHVMGYSGDGRPPLSIHVSMTREHSILMLLGEAL